MIQLIQYGFKNKGKFFLYFLLFLFSLVSVNATTNDAEYYYSYDVSNVSGSTLIDISGNGNDGTCTNMGGDCNTVQGILLNATDFSGGSDYVNAGTKFPTTDDSAFSISTWANGDTLVTPQYIASSGITGGFFYGWRLHVSGSNQISFNVRGNSADYTVSKSSLNTSQWYHLVGTYDGSTVIFYVDGVQVGNVTSAFLDIASGTNTLYIGEIATGAGQEFAGLIDETGIYNRALTPSEVTELYNNGTGFNPYDQPPSSIEFTNITANSETLTNNSFFNTTNILFETFLNTIDTNNNTNQTYFINGYTPNNNQFANNSLNGSLNINGGLSNGFYISFDGVTNPLPTINGRNITFNSTYDISSNGDQFCEEVLNPVSGMPVISTSLSGTYNVTIWNGTDWLNLDNVVNPNVINDVDCDFFNEGTFNISFYAFNNETNVSSNNYSITIDTTLPVINNNILTEYNTYTINGFNSSCSDTNLDYCNISINSQNVLLNTTSFTFTENGNFNYNITAKDLAGNIVTETGPTFINPTQLIRFNNTGISSFIQNYSITTHNNTFSITGEYWNFSLYEVGLGTNSFTFTKIGFENSSFNLTLNTTSDLNISYNVDPVTLFLQVYDADTLTQLTYNITILNSTSSSVFNNQFNLSKGFDEIPTGDIELQISSTGYTDVIYFQSLNPYTSIDLDAYMFKENISDVITFTVIDLSSGTALEGVLIELQDTINGSVVTLSQKQTTSTGQSFFYIDITQSYNIIFSKDGYVTATSTTIPGTSSYTVKLESTATSFTYVDDLSYSISPTQTILKENVSYNFVGFLSSTGITQSEFNIVWENGTSIYSAVSTNPTGTTFNSGLYLIPLSPNTSTIFANLTYFKDGVENQIIKEYTIIVYTNNTIMSVFENFGDETDEDSLLLRWILIMAVACSLTILGSISGIQSLNALLIPFFGFLTLIGWIDWVYGGLLIFISMVLYIGGRR